MMRVPRIPLVLCALTLLGLASAAHATIIAPRVILRAEAPSGPIAEGESFAIPIDIYVQEDAVVEEVRVRTDATAASLRFEAVGLARRPAEAPGYRHERRIFEGILEPGLDRVRVQVRVEGEVWEESFSLRGFGDPTVENTQIALGRTVDAGMLDATQFSRPDPVASGLPTADAVLAKAPRTVNVSGRIVMAMQDTGPDRGVDGATVYLVQGRFVQEDIELGSTTTDVNGNFSFDALVDGSPNLYVKVRAINSAANIGTETFFTTYGRNLPTIYGFGGTSIDIGTHRFTDDMNHALWLLTTFTRAQRWFDALGHPLPQVNCRWWDDVLQSSCYLPLAGLEGIHLRSTAAWNGATVVHEYGHHFVHASPANEVWPPYYLNGVCDPSHCLSCPENEAVAWSEGLPHFLQQEFNNFHRGIYGWDIPFNRTYETANTCAETGNFGEAPASTEGFFAAFLNDLIDANPDGSSLAPGVVEHSQLSIHDILTVATTFEFSNSLDFVSNLRTYLSGPGFDDQQRREFWAAAAVNGFAFDDVPPTPPLLAVPTHPAGVVSPSSVPVIFLSGATDDDSGVESYRIEIAATPGLPGPGALQTQDLALAWPTPLAEGTYYINATAVDRAGNESTVPTSYGPALVGPSGEVDLTLWRPSLWEDAVLLRHDTSVTASSGALAPVLSANQNLWLSVSTANTSPFSASVPSFQHRFYLNGNALHAQAFDAGLMLPNSEYQVINAGPFQFVGGRHHLIVSLDDTAVIPEGDESNFSHRFVVVRPALLPAGTWQGPFGGPPHPFTAAAYISQPFPNVAGHRFAPVNQYAGVMMATQSSLDDHSLRLHPISTGVDNGFEAPLAEADTRESQAEVMIVDKSVLGAGSFDVGVRRHESAVGGYYTMRHVSSQLLAPGDDTLVSWAGGDLLSLLQYSFNVLETGPFTVELEVAFAPYDTRRAVKVYWIEPGTGILQPHDTEPTATLTEDGRTTLELNVTALGAHCLVLLRDIRAGQAAPPMTIAVDTDTVPMPDLAVFRDNQFFDLPFLPSFEPVPGPKMSLPSQLIGGGYNTYLNYTIANTGQVPVQSVQVNADLDGAVQQQFFFSSVDVGAQSSATFFGTQPVFVTGGRHTMVLQIDPWGQVPERDETNNTLAMQFGWEGPALTPYANVTKAAPPAPEAGREFFEVFTNMLGAGGEDSVEQAINAWYPNSDGFRLPAVLPKSGPSSWTAVATMPTSNVNVDVRLHEVMPPIDAYGRALVTSTWGMGETDFVLVDHHAAGPGPFDASVVRADGNDSYTLVSIPSQPLGTVPVGGTAFGPMGMDGGGFLSLYHVDLDPGSYEVALEPQSNDADLGLTVYFPTMPLGSPFRSKDDGRDRTPMSFEQPAGAVDRVQFEVRPGEEGQFCIAVWKVGATDMQANQDFLIKTSYVPAAPECVRVDGTAEEAYGDPLAVQIVETAFGDSDLGVVDAANGSELDQAFARICDGVLYLTLTGNLESLYYDLEVFIDSRTGGQNRLLGNNPSFGDGYDLGRLGDDGTGNGLTFDAGFEPDWWFTVQGGFGEAFAGAPYQMLVHRADLLTDGGGEGRFLGVTAAGGRGLLVQPGTGAVTTGVRVAIDNTNTAGVTLGTGAASGAGVTTGVEFAIALEEIGDPTGCLRIVAFVNGKFHDFVSNQVLPPLAVGTDYLGDPRNVDFNEHAGSQYFIVCQGTVTDVGDDVPVALGRTVELHQPAPNPFNPRTVLSFRLPRLAPVELAIFDVSGRRVRTLVAGQSMDAGRHELVWEGHDDQGRRVASGSYLLRLVADGEQDVRRLVLLK